MRRTIAGDDVARLVRAAERMARMAQEISARAERQDDPEPAPTIAEATVTDRRIAGPSAERLGQAARDAMGVQRRQPDFGMPGMFGNPVWLLMLDLFAASRAGVATSVKAASLTLGGAVTTANRTILDLERHGLITSLSDETDARRRLLKLTPRADAILHDYLAKRIEHREPSLRLSLKIAKNEEQPTAPDDIKPFMDQSDLGIETVLQ